MTSERDLTVMLVANLIAAHDPCYKEAGGHDPWHEGAAGSVVGTVLRAVAAAPLPPVGDGGKLTDDAVGQIMQDQWDDICSDSGCWPLDIQRLTNRGPVRLSFTPGHWASGIASALRLALSGGSGAGHSSLAPVSPEGVEIADEGGLRAPLQEAVDVLAVMVEPSQIQVALAGNPIVIDRFQDRMQEALIIGREALAACGSLAPVAESVREPAVVYVASRASVPERGEMWRRWRAAGAPINSSWIDEDGPKASRDLPGLWVRIASEVTAAARLVLYVEPSDFPLKGAFIEVGMALAAGVPVVIVAPGVTLDERNCRPLGSWVKHPLVSFADTVEAAISRPTGGA